MTTTGSSVKKVVESVQNHGGTVAAVGVMLNRDPKNVNQKSIGAPFKALEELFKIYNYPLNLIKYIITDIAHKNVASWATHPALIPYIQSGIMDTAEFSVV